MMRPIFFLALVLLGCSNDDKNTPTVAPPTSFDVTNATLLKEGAWMGSGPYTVTGLARIYEQDGKQFLILDNFSSSNGPDLRVYLSTDENASSFISLGKLKATTGFQVYAIPDGTNLDLNKFTLIWCQQFSALFGKAEPT